MERKLILITGVIGSGKDYLAQSLKAQYEHRGYFVRTVAFADIVKEFIAIYEGIPILDKTFYDNWKKNPLNRERLIRTAYSMKLVFGKEMIAHKTAKTIEELLFTDQRQEKVLTIVTDLRFWYEFHPVISKWQEIKDAYAFNTAIDCTFYEPQIFLKNFKSERYLIKDSPSEAFPQWIIKTYPKDDTLFTLSAFKSLIKKFLEENPLYENMLIN